MTDHPSHSEVSEKALAELKQEIFQPLENYSLGRNLITKGTVSPSYLYADQFVVMEKLMDEYVGGWGPMYTTNEILLNRGLELMTMLREDLAHIAGEDLHQAPKSVELTTQSSDGRGRAEAHYLQKGNSVARLLLQGRFSKFYYVNWHVFVNSKYDRSTGNWQSFTRPCIRIVP